MGAHYRHTTPEMAARIAAAIEQRLSVVLEVAEQALEAQPEPLNAQSVLTATGRVFWQISGKRRSEREREMRKCLVELRGFEP
jgi:plasmid replication initiation protein